MNTFANAGKWQTIAKIDSLDGTEGTRLLAQHGSGDLDWNGRIVEDESTIGFLLRSRLSQAQTEHNAKLWVVGQDGGETDASDWADEELQDWIEQRQNDFIVEQMA